MTTRVRIRAGNVEIEYESVAEVSISDVKDLITHVRLSMGSDVRAAFTPAEGEPAAKEKIDVVQPPGDVGSGPTLHVNSVAMRLGAKTGSDLAEAAAATLQICERKETFTRAELLDTMKKANNFYKESMAGNLSKILNVLVKHRFNQVGNNRYSLSAETIKDLEAKIA